MWSVRENGRGLLSYPSPHHCYHGDVFCSILSEVLWLREEGMEGRERERVIEINSFNFLNVKYLLLHP